MWWSAWVLGVARAATPCSLTSGESIQEAIEFPCSDITLAPGTYEGFQIQGVGSRRLAIHGAGLTSILRGEVRAEHQGGGSWTVDLETLMLDPRSEQALRIGGEDVQTFTFTLDRVRVVCGDGQDCVTVDTAALRAVDTDIVAAVGGSPKNLLFALDGAVSLEGASSVRGGSDNGWLVELDHTVLGIDGTREKPVSFGLTAGGGVRVANAAAVQVTWARFEDVAGTALASSQVAQLGVAHAQFCGPAETVLAVGGGCAAGCVITQSGFAANRLLTPSTAIHTNAPLTVTQTTFRDLDQVVATENARVDMSRVVVFDGSLGGQGLVTVSDSLVDASVTVSALLDAPPVTLTELVSTVDDDAVQCAEFRYHPRIPENTAWSTDPWLAGIYAVDATDGADGDGVPFRFDCDDDDPGVHALQVEQRIDGLDDDCDGLVDCDDTTDLPLWEVDEDGDGWIAVPPLDVCTAGAIYDCDDGDPTVNDRVLFYDDADGDGFGAGNPVYLCPGASEGLVAVDGDCDDTRDDVSPVGVDLPNDGLDQDCSGQELVGVVEGGGCGCDSASPRAVGLLATAGVWLLAGYRTRRSGGSSGRSESGLAHRS